MLERIQWLRDPSATIKVAGKSGISQARTRLGWEPLRQLHDAVVKPIAVPATKGAWYRGWRLVSLDGSTLDVADEQANEDTFGRPGASRGSSANPQIRFVSLVENGTHVLFGSQLDAHTTGETTLAKTVLPSLRKGMLCLADRNFFGYELLKTHLRGAKIVLRSKTPDLVRQEFYGFLMAHFAIRGLMHEAALRAQKDTDRLSFLHAVRVVRRKLPVFSAIPPSAEESIS